MSATALIMRAERTVPLVLTLQTGLRYREKHRRQKQLANRRELQQLARLRLSEAEHLYAKGLHDGATYLCGYVVEFALKARICKLLKLKNYPDTGKIGNLFKTHNFDDLKLLAGLSEEVTAAKNPELFANWSIAKSWEPEQRYSAPGTSDRKKAQDALASIKDDPNGVLTWLSKRW